MKKVWLFNPDNDMALADDSANYIAANAIRILSEDLSLLPMWYADDDSFVLAKSAHNIEFMQSMKCVFQIKSSVITANELNQTAAIDMRPWGWNKALRKSLIHYGVPIHNVPSPEQLEMIKGLSSRSQAVALLPHLIFNKYFCGESFYFTSLDECRQYISNHSSCLLKAPYSGSGKGLNWCKGMFTDNISGWCNRVINTQGGIVAEPVYHKIKDFAFEFYHHADQIDFIGYSLFETSHSGAYHHHVLMSDCAIEELLGRYVPIEQLHLLRKHLIDELSHLLKNQSIGYLGVDMMICECSDDPFYRIHPCVEINLRTNMGIVAHSIFGKYVDKNKRGIFNIIHHSSTDELRSTELKMKQQYPLVTNNGRVVSGFLPLTPIAKNTQNLAFILIE